MNVEVLAVLIPIIGILSAVALPVILGSILLYNKNKSTHTERFELIKQGIIPPDGPKRKPKSKSIPNRYLSLRNGIILIALGIGIMVGFFGSNYLIIGEDNPFLFVIASIVLFLGIGYTVFFWITNNSNISNGVNAENNIEEDFE